MNFLGPEKTSFMTSPKILVSRLFTGIADTIAPELVVRDDTCLESPFRVVYYED
jgi:hypothetical protein